MLGRVSTRDDFADALRDGLLWVAEAAGTIVGFALLRFVGGLPHLDEIDVLPEHGRQGIGSRLLEAVSAWTKDAGHAAMMVRRL